MISISRLGNSFTYAGAGLRFAVKNDQNFRIHLITAGVVILFGMFLRISRIEMVVLLAMIVLVIAAEMINTSIEKMVDLITKEHREDAKIAKDVSSAMVLVVVAGSVIVASFIFLPYLFALIS